MLRKAGHRGTRDQENEEHGEVDEEYQSKHGILLPDVSRSYAQDMSFCFLYRKYIESFKSGLTTITKPRPHVSPLFYTQMFFSSYT